MPFYGFKNKRTGKYITGTDYRYNPRHQIMFDHKPPLMVYDDEFCHGRLIETEVLCREISLKQYELVRLNVVEEKDKGCEYCYGSNAPFYQVSTNGEPTLKMFTPKFCPMCGKVWGEYETT